MTPSIVLPTFEVRFGPNPRIKDMHKCLNRIYCDDLPDPSRLFVDPNDPTTVLDTPDLLTRLRTIIINDMILTTAGETTDGNRIALIINDVAIQVGCGQLQPKRISKQSLLKALDHALSHKIDTIDLIIDTSMFYFTAPTDEISYHDWSKFTLDVNQAYKFTPIAPSPAPAASTSPTPDAITLLAQAMTNALIQARSPTSANPSSSVPPSLSPGDSNTPHPFPARSPSTNPQNYHPGQLPPDVKERYESKLKGIPITHDEVTTLYAWGHRYYLDGNDYLILADGTLFTRRDFDEKAIFRELVPCLDDNFAGIRKWYQMFTTHLMNNGYYIHPLWCYRKDVGGLWGFTAGDDKDDDLPKRMELSLTSMSHTIFRLLSKSDMFPKDSELKNIISACYGDGYHALKSIMLHVHPIFQEYPAFLIADYPKQGHHTLLQYYQLFCDYLHLRAFVKNTKTTLDNQDELDIFIGNTKYRDYLIRVTREERRQPAMAHKFKGPQLLETLQKHLKAPDSPALIATSKTLSYNSKGNNLSNSAGHTSKFVPYQNKNRRHPPINNISVVTPTEHSLNDLVEQAYCIDLPNNPEDRKLFHVYTVAINRLQKKPVLAFSGVCICCHGNHRFDDCPILNDTEFLQEHYKRYCMQLDRELKAKDMRLATSDTTTERRPSGRHVNFFDCLEDVADTDNHDADTASDDDYHTTSDFQSGRP